MLSDQRPASADVPACEACWLSVQYILVFDSQYCCLCCCYGCCCCAKGPWQLSKEGGQAALSLFGEYDREFAPRGSGARTAAAALLLQSGMICFQEVRPLPNANPLTTISRPPYCHCHSSIPLSSSTAVSTPSPSHSPIQEERE